ncbi:SKI/DACH domain-containing protein 1-like [Impatiens glandulifera]|uniref:SKI/DACH domain-containing protein 1-like n=1 Tax=Impatiens glandulifera TaxID=253017 RepID=UPI001FB13488|nr:SKI/DACH domain-containing protein 1-like [Impatiens glandulifera]
MDSSQSCRSKAQSSSSPNQLHHHHHHHHHHPHHHFHIHFSPNCPFHSRLLQPNIVRPESLTADSCSVPFNSQTSRIQDTHPSNSLLFINGEKDNLTVEQEVEEEEEVEYEEEEEDDPVFVLTDEWREFFAQSEAKRRLAKKEAKRKSK